MAVLLTTDLHVQFSRIIKTTVGYKRNELRRFKKKKKRNELNCQQGKCACLGDIKDMPEPKWVAACVPIILESKTRLL